MKTLTQNNIDAKNATFSTIIFLYEIEIDSTTKLYYTNNVTDTVYKGQTYTAFPISHDNIEQDISGKIQSLSVSISNINNNITNILATNDIRGNTVEIKQIFQSAISEDPVITEKYYIDSVLYNESSAVFNLVSAFDFFDAKIPSRTINKDILPFVPESIFVR